jgi:acyl carrier protein
MDMQLPQSDQALVLREHLPLGRPYLAPRTQTERQLAEIWQQVLSMDAVGVEDDYNDLGGDSMLAAAIFGMIERSFAVVLPLKVLLDSPTVAKLAVKVDAQVAATAAGR